MVDSQVFLVESFVAMRGVKEKPNALGDAEKHKSH